MGFQFDVEAFLNSFLTNLIELLTEIFTNFIGGIFERPVA